jgi:D-sedoheptulose 7-phosphate isomerase
MVQAQSIFERDLQGETLVSNERISRIMRSLQESITVEQRLLQDKAFLDLVARVGGEFVKALRAGHKIILFGNGGSAAQAQHLAAEFVGRFQLERPPLPAVALTADTSALTGIGNDYGYENVFARQVRALGSEGDIALGLSTSGKSANVLKGLGAAKEKGLVTVGFVGRPGSPLEEHVQYCVSIPTVATARIQEAHILIGHILCEIAEAELAPVFEGPSNAA